MLDSEGYLPVERARELLAMIEARPLTKERLAQHYFDHITHSVEQHPITGWFFRSLRELTAPPPDFDHLAAFLRQRRTADRASKKIGRSQRAAALLRLRKQTSSESAFEREHASAVHRAHPPISTLNKQAI
jgi:hypothetical protein